MNPEPDNILRREFQHGKIAYGFQWNIVNHKRHEHTEGDSASLWAHLNAIHLGKVPELPFTTPFYNRASKLRLSEMTNAQRVGFRKKLERAGSIKSSVNVDLVKMIRDFHRSRNDLSYAAGHDILKEFLVNDPNSIAIEVPVWSERYRLSGHIDLVRIVDGVVQVCDYKPGPLENTKKRFLDSLPQVAAYGELMTHHLASTLTSAFETPLLPKVKCCIFDVHASWEFGAEMFVQLETTGMINGL
ncbi:MAG: PD-(D/E)XK nuclease family protein [Candidatus Thorarchaeota archaeon]